MVLPAASRSRIRAALAQDRSIEAAASPLSDVATTTSVWSFLYAEHRRRPPVTRIRSHEARPAPCARHMAAPPRPVPERGAIVRRQPSLLPRDLLSRLDAANATRRSFRLGMWRYANAPGKAIEESVRPFSVLVNLAFVSDRRKHSACRPRNRQHCRLEAPDIRNIDPVR